MNPSEIPCRVSNIAPNGSDPVQHDRLKSVEPVQRSSRSLVGNTEGKIAFVAIPVTTQD
jgi:hypothetical protein